MTGGKHAMPAGAPKHANRAHHVADKGGHTTGDVGTRQPQLAMRQWVSRMIDLPRVPELGGAVIAPDESMWEVMVRAAQTPACGTAVIVGLVLSGLSAEAPQLGALLTHHPTYELTPPATHRPTPRGPATTAGKLGSLTKPAPPIADLRPENPERLRSDRIATNDEASQNGPNLEPPSDNPDLEKALDELDRNADRDQASSSERAAPPGPAPSCSPICADSMPTDPPAAAQPVGGNGGGSPQRAYERPSSP
jgi:hypothetical protein